MERRVAAFGVTKSLAEWERDARSAVYAELIEARLADGWTPEQAIARPTAGVEPGPTKYLAWGERKTLRDWADDPRCETSYPNLRSRIQDGWDPEAALGTPTAARTARPITAWGETKSLRAWEKDERTLVQRGTIVRRLEEGWTPERALSTPPEDYDTVTAWGETKSRYAWSRDPRMGVEYSTLCRRLDEGWTPEEAIAKPPTTGPRLVTAWGETKSLSAWGEDPRATLGATGIAQRLDGGMAPEAAISSPAREENRTVEAWGEAKAVSAWLEDARCAVDRVLLHSRLAHGWCPERALSEAPRAHDGATAWGETKSLRAWSRDPRGRAHHTIVGRRLEQGWTPEEAISTPPKALDRTPITAFGETKSQTEWTRDPRCRVTLAGLRDRLAAGLSPEEAITRPVKPSNREGLEAFGEWRTFSDWARDPRCSVEAGSIQSRVAQGLPPEEAIVRPGRMAARDEAWTARPKGMPGFARRIVAWGEEKSATGWGKDPRAAVGYQQIVDRIAAGMTPELAISTPGKEVRKFVTAFGETKSTVEWAADSRVTVTADAIRTRLMRGFPPEEAIFGEDARPAMTVPREAFGESKTLSEWGRDARCVVNYQALAARVRKGMALEEALTTPARPESESKKGIAAFGETKRIHEWAADARCAVSASTLKGRLQAGWVAEAAIGQALTETRGQEAHEAFGEAKTLRAWAEDPRCALSYTELRARVLEDGLPLEEALLRPRQSAPFRQAA